MPAMTVSEPARRKLLNIVKSGLDQGVETLAKISKTNWHIVISAVLTGEVDEAPIPGEVSKDYYGAYFTMPAGAFLVLISERSGRALTNSFTAALLGKASAPRQEFDVDGIAEISNIIVNAVAGPLADACETGFLISAPQVSRGAKEELYRASLKRSKAGGGMYPVMVPTQLASRGVVSDCTLIVLLGPEWLKRLGA